MTVADTDVLIDFLRGHGTSARRVRDLIEGGALRTTTISRFELVSGAHTRRQRAEVTALLALVPTLPLDDGSADRAAEIRRALDQKGAGIGMADSLIAGIVVVARGTLLTRNTKHFERVPGLSLAASP